jgi:hypothetical protein
MRSLPFEISDTSLLLILFILRLSSLFTWAIRPNSTRESEPSKIFLMKIVSDNLDKKSP